ncbi:MAG: hypothetical protein ABH878_10615, partial [bacterium]
YSAESVRNGISNPLPLLFIYCVPILRKLQLESSDAHHIAKDDGKKNHRILMWGNVGRGHHSARKDPMVGRE